MTAVAAPARERPILFSGDMVRAILDGRKTQTRRVVLPQPLPRLVLQAMFGQSPDGVAFGTPGVWRQVGPDYPDDASDDRRCPFGVVGDRLYVLEAWRHRGVTGWSAAHGEQDAEWIEYRADTDGDTVGAWRPSIHMRREASRITLEVTGVRVERIHDITEADAVAEGAADRVGGAMIKSEEFCMTAPFAVYSFAGGWDRLNGARGYGWRANPWVWVVDFKRIVP